jgi:MFS family permease
VTSIRTVFSLIVALTILQLSQGLLGVHLPLAMEAGGFSQTWIGFAGAAYSLGFMAGAWLGPIYMSRLGHIRVFAAAAAIATAITLAVYWAHGLAPWLINRFATGAAIALLFAAGESWMNGAMGHTERGNVIGFYMVCTKAALALGPFLIAGAAPTAPEPLMTAAILLALCMAPICFTSQAQPEPPQRHPLAIGALYRTAPIAVVACFSSGLINAGLLTISPLYAQERFGPGAAVGFQAAAWVGSLILQWPAARLSDRIDRPLVIAALTALAAAAALALAALNARLTLGAASLIFAFWGAGALSFYGIGVAHMADRAEPGHMARATAGLLFVWAAGSVIGPAILGVLADSFGKVSIFWYAGALYSALAIAMLWRRPAGHTSERHANVAVEPVTSVAAADLAFAEEDEKG